MPYFICVLSCRRPFFAHHCLWCKEHLPRATELPFGKMILRTGSAPRNAKSPQVNGGSTWLGIGTRRPCFHPATYFGPLGSFLRVANVTNLASWWNFMFRAFRDIENCRWVTVEKNKCLQTKITLVLVVAFIFFFSKHKKTEKITTRDKYHHSRFFSHLFVMSVVPFLFPLRVYIYYLIRS